MARLAQSGIESGVVTATMEAGVVSGTMTADTVHVRTGTYALKIASGNTASYQLGTVTLTAGYASLWLYLTGSPSTARIISHMPAGAGNTWLRLNTNRTVTLGVDAATERGTTTTVCALNGWTQVELHFVASGTCELRMNGGDVEVTGTGGATAMTWGAAVQTGSLGTDIWFDDLIVNDTTGILATSWVGLAGIVNLVPAADSGTNAWTAVGSPASHAAAVADLSAADTTLYLQTTSKTANLEDRWTLADTPAAIASTDVIEALQWGVRGGADGTTARPTILRIRDSAANIFDSATLPLNVNEWKTVFPAHTVTGLRVIQDTFSANLNFYGATGTLEARAQSFSVAEATTLAGVGLWLRLTGTPADGILVSLVSALDGTPLASTTVPAASLSTTPVLIPWALDPPMALAVGTYYLQLTRTGARDLTNYYGWRYNSGSVYAGGSCWTRANGSWTAQATEDHSFQLFFGATKAWVDGLTAAAIDTDTSVRLVNWTAVWATVAFAPPPVAPPRIISVTDALVVGTPAPTVQRIGGTLDTGTLTDTLALTSPAFVAVPFVAVPDGLAALALTTTTTVRVSLRPFPTDLLALDSTSTVAAAVPLGPVTEVVRLLDTPFVHLPWLTPTVTEILALESPGSLRLTPLPAMTEDGLLLVDDPDVSRGVEGILEPELLLETVALDTPVLLHLPWLTPETVDAVALTTPVELHVLTLPAMGSSGLILTDPVDVERALEGLWEVSGFVETVALDTTVLLHLPWLTLLTASPLTLAEPFTSAVPLLVVDVAETVALTTPVTLHLPWLTPLVVDPIALDTVVSLREMRLLVASGSALVLTDVPEVQRTIEGVWQPFPLPDTVALATTSLLRLPWLTPSVTSAVGVVEPQTTVVPLLIVDVVETVALTTPVTLRLPWLRPLASSAVLSAEVTAGRLPLLHLLATDTLALTTTPDVTRSSETLLTPPTRIETLALGEVTALQLQTSFLTTDEMALGSVGMTTVGMSLFVEDTVILDAISLLITTVYGQSATTVVLAEFIAVQSNWIALMQHTDLQVGTAVALRGLAVRGVHAAQMQVHTASIPTPVLAQGRGHTPALWGPTMRGTLRQGQGTEEVVHQADIDDAVLV